MAVIAVYRAGRTARTGRKASGARADLPILRGIYDHPSSSAGPRRTAAVRAVIYTVP